MTGAAGSDPPTDDDAGGDRRRAAGPIEIVDAPAGPRGDPGTRVFLGLGSNVGDRVETLHSAVYALDDAEGIRVIDVSGVYETEPWGPVEQERFLNCVVRARTSLDPHALLDECQLTERAFGRDRDSERRWGPRTLDIDLLLYGDEEIDTARLTVPHPRIAERAFVLVPLVEVFPGGELPDGRRLTALLAELAPVENVELVVRLPDVPGPHLDRPEGPAGPGALSPEQWNRPRGAPPGTER